MVTPSFVLVVDNSSSKAPCRVNSGAGDRNSGKILEHLEDNESTTYGDMRISGTPLGISGGENGVHKNKSSDDLRRQPHAFAVPNGQLICSAAVPSVVRLLEGFHQPNAAYRPQTLRHHVHHRPD
nr:unknown [Ipomoea trifida]